MYFTMLFFFCKARQLKINEIQTIVLNFVVYTYIVIDIHSPILNLHSGHDIYYSKFS